MDYNLRVLDIKNKKMLVLDIKDKKYEMISVFLQSDVVVDFEWYKRAFQSVLNEEKDRINGTGNICEFEITQEKTRIHNAFADDKEFCEVNTEELYNTLTDWEKDYKSFAKS